MSKSTSGGTVRENLIIGLPGNTTKTITANMTGTTDPGLRYDSNTSVWQYSNDGATWTDMGSGGGGKTIFWSNTKSWDDVWAEVVAASTNEDGYAATIFVETNDIDSEGFVHVIDSGVYDFSNIKFIGVGNSLYAHEFDGYRYGAGIYITGIWPLQPTLSSPVINSENIIWKLDAPIIFSNNLYLNLNGGGMILNALPGDITTINVYDAIDSKGSLIQLNNAFLENTNLAAVAIAALLIEDNFNIKAFNNSYIGENIAGGVGNINLLYDSSSKYHISAFTNLSLLAIPLNNSNLISYNDASVLPLLGADTVQGAVDVIKGIAMRQEYVAVAGNQSALDGYYAQIGATYMDPSIHSLTATFNFQVILEAPVGGDAYVQLYNQTDGYEITASELFTSEIVPTFLETQLYPGVTSYFETTPTLYTVRAYTTLDGYAAICKMARIEVKY
jgi:hypothetical protein